MGDAEAGWYEDGSGRLRWWDGTKWHDLWKDKPAPLTPPPPPKPGTDYNPAMDKAAAPGLQPKKSSSGFWGCLGCLGVILVVVVIFGVVGANREPYDGNNEYEAISQCEARIERLLKAPATAEFDSKATGGGSWTVNGTVDSENGFGAKIRSSFQCSVVIEGDTATTTVDWLE